MTHEDYYDSYYDYDYDNDSHNDYDSGAVGAQTVLGGAYLLFWIAIALLSICIPFVAACCVIKTYNRD